MAESFRPLAASERVVVAVLLQGPSQSARDVFHALSGLEAGRCGHLSEVTSVRGVLAVLDRLSLAQLVTQSEDGVWNLSPRTRELLRLGQAATAGVLEVANG
jgi:hypothetical protein